MTIQETCYELYKADWLKNHLEHCDIMGFLDDFLADGVGETINDWLWQNGFNGELYVCFEEFLDYEYLDEGYMEILLHDDDLFDEYKQDVMENFGPDDDDYDEDDNDDDNYGDGNEE